MAPNASAASPTPTHRLRTVSHTLDEELAQRLRLFAFRHRLSESSIIEHALAAFLHSGTDDHLAWELREAGYGLRRRTG